MTDRCFASATSLVASLTAGEVGVLELCDYFIDRIERIDPKLNAVVVKDFERARQAAAALDNLPLEQRGRLAGLPITVKESFNLVGQPTTWGHAHFLDNIADSDAEAVKRYRSAGAVVLGKTNVPVDLGDYQSFNPVYGTTNNPWDVSRTPGGSSGGASAAVAAGLTGLDTGSDIGGSIRNPAHFCGIYGHKPTWGVVPSQGHALPGQAAGPDLSVCGPLARSADDLALAMQIISGAEPLNTPGWQLQLPAAERRPLRDYRVAVWANDAKAPVDREIENSILRVGRALQDEGATVSYEARPAIDLTRSHETYLTLLHSVLGATASNETRAKSRQVVAELAADDHSDPALMARAMIASHGDWLRANNYREKLRYKWQAFFQQWDILLCPQMATAAFSHDQSSSIMNRSLIVNGEPQSYFQQIFWSGLVTAPYLPSTVFPAGFTERDPIPGLPVGIQAIGAEYQDYSTIEFARLLAAVIGGFQPPPL